MAHNHLNYNRQSVYGPRLFNTLNQAEASDTSYNQLRNLMLNMIDGDGSQISMFDEVVKQFGFLDYIVNGVVNDAQRTEARNAWLQIDSAYSATVSAAAARNQLYNFLRQ